MLSFLHLPTLIFICIIYTCEVSISEVAVPAEIPGTAGRLLHPSNHFSRVPPTVPAEIAGTAGGTGGAGLSHLLVLHHLFPQSLLPLQHLLPQSLLPLQHLLPQSLLPLQHLLPLSLLPLQHLLRQSLLPHLNYLQFLLPLPVHICEIFIALL